MDKLKNCKDCGNAPIISGVAGKVHYMHTIKCKLCRNNNTGECVSIKAAIKIWNKLNE